MPYKSVDDLPDGVKNHLPLEGKRMFLKVFNAAYDEYKEEDRAFKVAWHAIKQKFKKGADGQWRKNKLCIDKFFAYFLFNISTSTRNLLSQRFSLFIWDERI